MTETKIVFFGTPAIAAVILEKLIEAGFKPVAVVTREDKPVGRKKIITPPPVKIVADKYQIAVWQPAKLKDNSQILQQLTNIKPDLAIAAAYGRIIPKEILNIPKLGFLNIHPSLLPKYRGASPIQSAILEDAKITGVTIMLMDEELDHGPILAQQSIPIKTNDTASSLGIKLAELAANLLIEILPIYITWKKQVIKSQQKTVYSLFLPPKEQDHKLATFTKILKKEDGFISLENPPTPKQFQQMIKAFHPWPGVYTKSKMKDGKIQIIKFLPDNPFLVQPEGKKPMSIKEFLNGHPEFKPFIEQLISK